MTENPSGSGTQAPQSAPQGLDGAQDARGAERAPEGRCETSAPLTLPRGAAESLHAVLGELLGDGAARPLTWAETVSSHGVGDTATVDIDVHIPGRGEPEPVEIPLADAEMLHDMLGDVIGEMRGTADAEDGLVARYAAAIRAVAHHPDAPCDLPEHECVATHVLGVAPGESGVIADVYGAPESIAEIVARLDRRHIAFEVARELGRQVPELPELREQVARLEKERDEVHAALSLAHGQLHSAALSAIRGKNANIHELVTRAEQAEELLQAAHETSNRSEAERARAAAELERADRLRAAAQRDRDQHAAVLRDVLSRFTKAMSADKQHVLGFTGPTVDEDAFDYWHSVIAPTAEEPWWVTVAEVRAEWEKALAALARVREELSACDDDHWMVRAGDIRRALEGDAGAPVRPDTAEQLEQIGWYCWRCRNFVTQACRSDNVPMYAPHEWAEEMVGEIKHIEDGDYSDPNPTVQAADASESPSAREQVAGMETELAAARAEAATWRHKAVRRAIGTSRLRGTLAAVLDVASEDVTRADTWGDGYRAAQVDLREALTAFGYPDQELIAERERMTRGGGR